MSNFLSTAWEHISTWASHVWNTQGVQDSVKDLETGAGQAVKAAVVPSLLAGLAAAKAPDAHWSTTRDAATSALVNNLKTVDVVIATDTAEKIGGHIADAVHGTDAGTAPPPPAA